MPNNPSDAYAPPKTSVDSASASTKTTTKPVIVPRGIALPLICAKCGVTESVMSRPHRFPHALLWLSLALLVLAFFGNTIARNVFGLEAVPPDLRALLWLSYYAIHFAMYQKFSMDIPLCDACEKRWVKADRLGLTSKAVGCLLLGVLPLAQHLPESIAFKVPSLVQMIGWLVFFATVWSSGSKSRLVVMKTEPAQVTFVGLHPAAAAAYVETPAPTEPVVAPVLAD